MKLNQITALCLGGVLILSACKKEPSQTNSIPDSVSSFSEIVAPEGFDFNASKEISLNFTVENKGFQAAHSIEVYDSNPFSEGELIFKGFTKNDKLSTALTLPSSIKKLYVVYKDPSGAGTTEQIPVVGNTVSFAFGKKSGTKKVVVVSPDCSAGCDYSYANQSGNFNINNNDPAGVYCFTGNTTASINVNRSGVTIRLCGTADMQNLNLNQSAILQIVDAADVTIKNLGVNTGSSVYIYDADVFIDNNLSTNGTVVNYGTLDIKKSLNVNNGSTFTNDGNMTMDNDLNVNSPLTNNGSITVDGHANFNGGSTTVNNCSFFIKSQARINGTLSNFGYIEVDDEVKINGGSSFTLDGSAMLYGKDKGSINAFVTGTNSTSVMKIDGNVSINGGAGISGNLELCIGGSLTNNGSINAPATLVCDQAYIPTSGCNPAGNGTPTVADADNDNVADSTDLFPNDPARAGEYYYPSANTFATIAFEDLWPGTGDYDFNDLVIDYRIRWITDANNDIKDMEFDYSVRAIGASQKNGFGLEISAAPALVESVTRTTALSNQISVNANGTETGQSNIVLIFFENAGDELANPGSIYVNTQLGEAYSVPSVSQVAMTFSTAQNSSSIEFNPFMFINQNRGREVHMAGQGPTDLADPSYFGNSSDDSDPNTGRYYVNKNNLPWAIAMPASFEYPAEKVDLVSAYHYFYLWAINGGQSNSDWYMNNTGYRNSSLIY